jgi:hypothetical protein
MYWKVFGRKRSWPNLRQYPCIFLEDEYCQTDSGLLQSSVTETLWNNCNLLTLTKIYTLFLYFTKSTFCETSSSYGGNSEQSTFCLSKCKKITCFWDDASFSLVETDRHFRASYFLNHEDSDTSLSSYMEQHPRRESTPNSMP